MLDGLNNPFCAIEFSVAGQCRWPSGTTISKMAATKCKSLLKEKRFSNSEVDSRWKEAEHPYQICLNDGSKFKKANEICNNKKKGATFKQLFENVGATCIKAEHGLSR